ncbi:MAG TPA: crossover junction endodeoxyribonuclease RuvC [Methylomirabilota bacterium]
MGVDPGLVATGFGVLEAGAGAVTVRDAGVISTSTGQPLEARLNALHRAVHRIIEEQAPGLLVVEDLYTEYRFPRTAILMGHARGVIYLAARQLGVAVVALTPSEVKRAMTGNGAAGKAQVQRAVQTVLGLREPPRPSHVADALGLAATGMSRITGRLPGRAAGLAGTNGLSAGRRVTGRVGECGGQAPERMTGGVGECGGHFGAPADEGTLPAASPPPAASTRLGTRGRA